jgi:PAS domain S-box-containing protein
MRWMPHLAVTRHMVAFSQVTFSALLIHLTGGRIETHFHIFGSLAFLSLYRDWRVLPTATLFIAADHLFRGLEFPESMYGVPYSTTWRSLEHTLWVLFEVVVLVWACLVSRREMWDISLRQDQNDELLDRLEDRVKERTRALESEMAQRERTAKDLRLSEERLRELVDNAPIGIFKTTEVGDVLLANPHLRRLIGLALDQDLSRLSLADGRIFPAADRTRFWDRLKAEREVHGFAATLHRADGTAIEVLINARLNPTAPGEVRVCEGTIEDVTERNRAARELEAAHGQLVVASRQAGMAEVATGVLHNVGNVLTSVNLTIHDVLERLRASRLSHLHRVAATLQREAERLPDFLRNDPAGRQLPGFIVKLDEHLADENTRLRADMETLADHFEHIRDIVVTQQSSAKLLGVTEALSGPRLFEDALRLAAESLDRHAIDLRREFGPAPEAQADRHRVLQILVNLLKNAKDAVLAHPGGPRRIAVGVGVAGDGRVALKVSDTGHGIAPENLPKIFRHGFTTKENGHGFGLHSCVLAAREMGGDLLVASEGPGRGAVFTVLLPAAR